MLNIDKVKGVMRAKYGSQIPKYDLGGYLDWLVLQNQYMAGSTTAFNIPDATDNTLPNITTPSNFSIDWKPEPPQLYGNDQTLQAPTLTTPFKTPGGFPGPKIRNNLLRWNNPVKTPTNPADTKNGFLKALGGIGNFAKNNSNVIGMGLDAVGNLFNRGVTNNKGTNAIFGVGDTIANGLMAVNPVAGLIGKGVMTAVKGINNVFGKKTKDFSIDQNTLAQVGGSYGGSVADINEAASKANKKYGLFSSGSRRKANRLIDSADAQLDIMADIAGDVMDLRAMINDLNYLNYQMQTSGGYDLRYMRAAKSGMKLLDKIDFIKSERTINNVINLDTKEIEWEPVISDETYWEPIITDTVEEFKEGGILSVDTEWEPVIEDAVYWEPIITEVEEFKDGGAIKEELETPEIEETNQKNLIPEGALHKNKHHMEHTEGLTLKGIPVIDNEGEQQAEIELNEIIFTLEVTKKLEELYKDGSDEAAIEAGKLLVKEILFNTDDRTGLIAKCEKGGKINEVE